VSRLHRARSGRPSGARGQSLVEFAVAVPVFIMLLFGMLEFGFAFSHNLTLEYATREGARTGAALGKGTATVPCAQVDQEIIAGVQRVLTSPGSPVDINRISQLTIYQSNPSGGPAGPINIWVPGAGPTVDGVALKFKSTSVGWDACGRDNGSTPDSVGIGLIYSYRLISPLGIFLGMTGTPAFSMSDHTIMALNPS
jgi:TadE-like protein